MTEDDWLIIIMFIKRYISENYPQKGKPHVTIENGCSWPDFHEGIKNICLSLRSGSACAK